MRILFIFLNGLGFIFRIYNPYLCRFNLKRMTSAVYTNGRFNWPEMRLRKEALLQQRARVIWMCGLSGAGKSTLAARLDQMLFDKGYLSQVIDGDMVRSGLNRGLGFSEEDRRENLRRVAELARLFLHCGVITLVSFISPSHESRKTARTIIGEENFLEVFINAPLDVCELRDTKGLYRQARQGLIREFTGIDSPFEEPVHPDLEIRTDRMDIDESAGRMMEYILPFIAYKE
jgi:adenylylsulfate kinase